MSREEIERLLGGYATGTLTDEEQRALFAAALEDQELFDALAKEQVLREVLDDPAARQQVLDALGPGRKPFAGRAWNWLRRPSTLAAVGSLALLLMGAGLILRQSQQLPRSEVMVADAVPVRRGEPELKSLNRSNLQARIPDAKKALLLPKPPAPSKSSEPAGSADIAAASPTTQASPATSSLQDLERELAKTRGSTSLHAELSREFLQATRAKAREVQQPLVSFSLLLKSSDGSFLPAAPGAVLHAGDSVRIQAAPSETGALFLYRKNSDGQWSLVAAQQVEKGQLYVMPSDSAIESATAGQVELELTFSSRFEATPTTNAEARRNVPGGAASRIVLEFH